MFWTYIDNESCETCGIIPTRRPSIPAPEEQVEEHIVSGRNGAVVRKTGKYKPITISVEFNFLSNDWGGTYRRAKRWLAKTGKLSFSDDAGCFYKILYTKLKSTERESARKGLFTAEFVCDPFTYYNDGARERTLPQKICNPGRETEPIYIIKGEGTCTLEVNGRQLVVDVKRKCTVDTGLMISYCEEETMINTDVTGYYEDLYLVQGENILSATPGFDVTIIPNWRDL